MAITGWALESSIDSHAGINEAIVRSVLFLPQNRAPDLFGDVTDYQTGTESYFAQSPPVLKQEHVEE